MAKAILINDRDSVAIASAPVKKGERVVYRRGGEECSVTALADIPVYHKIAVANVPQGKAVVKYGEPIGRATQDIAAGEHVHTHNLTDIEEGR